MPKIKVIVGSNRPTRFATQPANWLIELAKNNPKAEFELVDLAEINLPFLDEAAPAMMGQYQNEHTKEWSRIIGEADGFVFIAPEYNHGYTPVLKNAIDYLYAEWLHKPVAFVSYGAAAGGARAVDQLRPVVGHLNMYDLSEHVTLPNYFGGLDENGTFAFTADHEKMANTMIDSLVFWADQMKQSRAALNA
jgi:NAD(P)H-dependent FMN reductase